MSNIKFPFNDKIGSVRLIESMGSDLAIVNDARVSYDSESDVLSKKDKMMFWVIAWDG